MDFSKLVRPVWPVFLPVKSKLPGSGKLGQWESWNVPESKKIEAWTGWRKAEKKTGKTLKKPQNRPDGV